MSAPAETYLSGFCSGGAEWAHDHCPAHWKEKPCRCACHDRRAMAVQELAETLCQAYHPTRWVYAATRSPCFECSEAAPAVLVAMEEEDSRAPA